MISSRTNNRRRRVDANCTDGLIPSTCHRLKFLFVSIVAVSSSTIIVITPTEAFTPPGSSSSIPLSSFHRQRPAHQPRFRSSIPSRSGTTTHLHLHRWIPTKTSFGGLELSDVLYDDMSTAFDAWEWTANMGAPAALYVTTAVLDVSCVILCLARLFFGFYPLTIRNY